MVAQQMMALVLEYPGLPAHEVVGVARTQFPELDRETVATVFDFMVAKGILFVSSGLASMGPEGEKLFGRAHFLDLLSAFASPMVLAARHGPPSWVMSIRWRFSSRRMARRSSCLAAEAGK
jgi:ATP-dependent Lhr-like helicase